MYQGDEIRYQAGAGRADIEFIRSFPPRKDDGIGWKAMAVNVSDIAGKGGIPRWALVGLAVPADTDVEAVDAFYSTIGLTDDPTTLNILSFTGIASNQAALGNFCDAIEPLQIWLSIDPSNRDTPRLRKMMDDYASKGKCEGVHARGKARFPIPNNNVISADVEINGVRGRFIVDTGASFVVVTSEFASKADLKLSGDYPLIMQTANGVSKAQRTTIKTIELGAVSAQDVAAVVLQGGPSTFGGWNRWPFGEVLFVALQRSLRETRMEYFGEVRSIDGGLRPTPV